MKQFKSFDENVNFANEHYLGLNKQAKGRRRGDLRVLPKTFECADDSKNNTHFCFRENLKKRTMDFRSEEKGEELSKACKKVKKSQKDQIRRADSREKGECVVGLQGREKTKFKSKGKNLKENKSNFNLKNQNKSKTGREEKKSKTKAIVHQKAKKNSLKTAYLVLKAHIKKFKNNLLSFFKASTKTREASQNKGESKTSLTIKTNNKKSRQLILIFSKEEESGIIENERSTTEAKELHPKKLDGDVQTRSGRRVNHLHLSENHRKKELPDVEEIAFAQSLSKFEKKMLNLAEQGAFVYFRDYLSLILKQTRILLEKYPRLSRKRVIQTLALELKTLRNNFIRETSLEYSKLSRHLEKFKLEVGAFPRSHLQSRIFEDVEEYSTPDSLKKILDKQQNSELSRAKYTASNLLRSDKVPQCSGPTCTCSTEGLIDFCSFQSVEYKWKSQCIDKERRVECDQNCGCDEKCKNSPIYRNQTQKCDRDVSIRQTWGIDFYSRKNMFHLLPSKLEVDQKALIIDEIVRHLNFQNHNGWNILRATQKIHKKLKGLYKKLKTDSESFEFPKKMRKWKTFFDFNSSDLDSKIQLMKMLVFGFQVLVKQLEIKQLRELVKAYSKGLGVVCTRDEGIPANSLIVQYFGEVYPSWLWYFKQDVIKEFLLRLKHEKKNKLSKYRDNYSMEFYNIFLEKHRDEPDGTELLIIDPILRGNYASRLSHSCDPNCFTIPVVSNRKYSIGLYSQKQIEPGDELTFDYCSFTESEKEYLNSICLCGSSICRGYYLSYNRKHEQIFKDAECILLDNPRNAFLLWNSLILKSSMSTFDSEKRDLLKKHAIGNNVFKNSPDWLRVWAYFILKESLKERKKLYSFYFSCRREDVKAREYSLLTEKEMLWKHEIESLFQSRLQNLMISFDKVLNFLDHQPNTLFKARPFVKVPLERCIKDLRGVLLSCISISTFNDDDLKEKVNYYLQNKRLLYEELEKLPHRNKNSSLVEFMQGKYLLLLLSEYFRESGHNLKVHPALADILYFQSLTKHYFKMNDFRGFEIQIDIRDSDLTNPHKFLTKSTQPFPEQLSQTKTILCCSSKAISPLYLWGQLVYWSKQTLDKPEDHLKKDARGPIYFPDMKRSFVLDRREIHLEFPGGSRRIWLNALMDSPAQAWRQNSGWHFGKKSEVFGNFLLDDFLADANNRFTILDAVDNGIVFKKTVFYKIWKTMI